MEAAPNKKCRANLPRQNSWEASADAGIVGGTNIDIFKELYEVSKVFLYENRDVLGDVEAPHLNTYLEQYVLKQLAISQGIEVKTAIDRPIGPEFDYELDKFHLLPDNTDFIHALSYKTNPSFCEMMAQRLWLEDAKLYERCQTVYSRRFSTYKHYQPAAKAKFGRTNQIAKLLVGDTYISRSSPRKKDLLTLMQNVKSRDVIGDIYEYEACISRYKSFVAKNIEGIDSEWKGRIQMLNNIQLEDAEIMGMTNIRLSKFSKLVDSEWKWAEKGVP